MKKLLSVLLAVLLVLSLTGCVRESETVTYNVKRDADSFEVRRKLTVMNMRTDKVILELEGLFAISNNSTNELQIVIEKAPNQYILDYVYLNDWTAYVVEQVDSTYENKYDYTLKIIPEMIVPFELEVE